MLYLASNRQLSRHRCKKPMRVRFFETEAQHELSMTPDQSINECTEKETLYQREFYQVGNLL